MPWLSACARKRKCAWFFQFVPKSAAILEIGCGEGWVGAYARAGGWTHYTGLDLKPPADLLGDIRHWRALGLKENTFDVIIAFEVVEHLDCFDEMFALLRPGGLCLLTSPIPQRDGIMRLLEALGLNQKRTSPHDHLIAFETIPRFEPVALRHIAGLAQWGVLRKPGPQQHNTHEK